MTTKLLFEKGRVKVKVKAKNILSELFTGNEEVALQFGVVKILLMLPLTNLTNSWQTEGGRDSKLKVTDSNAKITLKGTTFKIQRLHGTIISTDDQ